MSIYNKIRNKKQVFLPLASLAILSGLIFGGNLFGGGNNPPLFQNLDNFVLFGQEEVKLGQGVQVSSGDIGSNKEINIEKDNIINGNLFSDKITIDKNTTINGNASFNKLKIAKESQILGIQTKPVQLPIANLPEIPEFSIGTQDFRFQGQDNTLPSGNYRNIILEKDSRLTMEGGIYNFNKLELKENSILIFNAPTTLNIQFKLKGQSHISILPGQNLKPDDLSINYIGIRPKQQKDGREDDDEEIQSLMDAKEKKDHKDRKIGRPIIFGKDSFLNFKLLAPKAKVYVGETSTIRGQIAAKKIRIGKNSILSREEVFEKESDLAKIVEDQGAKFIVNEIVILFKDEATIDDLFGVADLVHGRLTGFLPDLGVAKIEVMAGNIQELNSLVDRIKNSENPFIENVLPNILIL